jgi:hypothetical protein
MHTIDIPTIEHAFRAKLEGINWSHGTSVHACLRFRRQACKEDISQATQAFFEGLAGIVGVKIRRLHIAGVFIAYGDEYHLHALVRSPRSRRTGLTVSRLKEDQQERFEETIKEDGIITDMRIKAIYDLPGIANYITGKNNTRNLAITDAWTIIQ